MTLHDIGRGYYERAQRILEELDFADDAAGGHESEPHALLRIAAPVTFCTLLIAPLLPELARRYPRLELDIRLSDSVSNMIDDSIDVAVRITTSLERPWPPRFRTSIWDPFALQGVQNGPLGQLPTLKSSS